MREFGTCESEDCDEWDHLWLVVPNTPAGDVLELDPNETRCICNGCMDDVVEEIASDLPTTGASSVFELSTGPTAPGGR